MTLVPESSSAMGRSVAEAHGAAQRIRLEARRRVVVVRFIKGLRKKKSSGANRPEGTIPLLSGRLVGAVSPNPAMNQWMVVLV